MIRTLRALVLAVAAALACGSAAGGVAGMAAASLGVGSVFVASVAQAQDERGPSSQEADRLLPEVRPGFDGLGKAGRWLPVQVVVASDGPALTGEVRLVTRLPGGGTRVAYSQDVEVAQRGRKLLQVAAPAPGTANELRVELISGMQELAARPVQVRLLNPTDFLVGVLSEDGVPPAGLASVRRGGGSIGVARLTTVDIPTDPVVLQALDAIVVRNAATDRLTTEQRAALRAWIELGGQLIVSGGPGWRRSIDGLDDLLPVEGLWSRDVKRLRAFARYAGVEPPEDSAIVTLGTPIQGARVLLAQDSIPLIVEHWLGQGRVTFLGVDPSLEPFRSWPSAESLWQRILVGGRPGLPLPDDPGTGPVDAPLRGVLANLMDVGLPSAGWLAGLIVLYVALVGPGQYVLLRRLDRREWAWLGFPLLALGFAGTIYSIGTRARGPDVRFAAVSVVRSVPEATTAPVDTYLGLVAPTRRAYDLAFADSPSVRALPSRGGVAGEEAVVKLGPPTRLPGLRLEGRTLQGFQTRTFGPAPTPIRAELRTTTGRLEGLVRNVGPDRLEDVILLAAGEALALGDIPPGESRPVSLALPTTRAGGPWRPASLPWTTIGGPALVDQRRQLLATILQPSRGADGEAYGGAILMGWVGATPPRLTVDGVTTPGAATRLVEQALPVEYGADTVLIPPGLLGRSIVDGAALGRGPAPSFVARGPIVFQYDLPPGLDLARIDRLSVHASLYGPTAATAGPAATSGVAAGGSASAGRVSLFRWAYRTWVDVAVGSTGVGDAQFGAAFVDGGAIRLRLEPHGPETIVQQLDLSLEGVRR